MRMFLEILIQSAYADGSMHPEERKALLHICTRLGFSQRQYEHLEAMIRAAREQFGAGGAAKQSIDLTRAYEILDINKSATDAEVKKAYRRLTNQHHPDKLVAKGLPEEMMKLAEQKTHDIRQAYERIRSERGFR
jgi:DnaJ like chaperone protein